MAPNRRQGGREGHSEGRTVLYSTWGRQGWHQIEGRGAGKVTVKAGLYCTPPGGGRDGTKSKAGGQGKVTVKAGLYCTPPGLGRDGVWLPFVKIRPGGGRDGTKSKAGGQGRSQ